MVIEFLFMLSVLVTNAGVCCLFVTLNLYIQTFCKDLAIMFGRMDELLEDTDHLRAKKLRVDAIEFLIKIDE